MLKFTIYHFLNDNQLHYCINYYKHGNDRIQLQKQEQECGTKKKKKKSSCSWLKLGSHRITIIRRRTVFSTVRSVIYTGTLQITDMQD